MVGVMTECPYIYNNDSNAGYMEQWVRKVRISLLGKGVCLNTFSSCLHFLNIFPLQGCLWRAEPVHLLVSSVQLAASPRNRQARFLTYPAQKMYYYNLQPLMANDMVSSQLSSLTYIVNSLLLI